MKNNLTKLLYIFLAIIINTTCYAGDLDGLYSIFGVQTSYYSEDWKSISECSYENLNNVLDQLAKAHVIFALTNDNHVSFHNFRYKDGAISISNNYDGALKNLENIKNQNIFLSLVDPYKNIDAAHVFKYPFEQYTLKNIDTILQWLNSCWDEDKIKSLIQDGNKFAALKIRFQEIKDTLLKIKDDKDFINKNSAYTTTTRHQTYHNLNEKFVKYNPENTMPTLLDQMFFCHNDSSAWLELTNYEFLVNSKESNRLVTIYLGKSIQDAEKEKNVIQDPIAIHDPESVFVFQSAILKYLENSNTCSLFDLAKAIQSGHDAIEQHFGYTSSLTNNEAPESINSVSELVSFINNASNKYFASHTYKDRYISIKTASDLGFTAYYPNPIYLPYEVVWYTRPHNMSYEKYALNTKGEVTIESVEILISSNDEPLGTNEWCDIVKRSNSDIKDKDSIHCLRDKNYIVFRGDSRSIKEIFEDKYGRIPSPFMRGGQSRSYSDGSDSKSSLEILEENYKKYGFDKEKIINNQYDINAIKQASDLWKFYGNGYFTNNAFLSASLRINEANAYGDNIYAISTSNGIEAPTSFKSDAGESMPDEVVIPLFAKTADIVGTRYRNERQNEVGPVFIKNNFELNNQDNFWKLLQTFGGKSQMKERNKETRLELKKLCDIDNTINELYIEQPDRCTRIAKTAKLNTYASAKGICSDKQKNSFVKVCGLVGVFADFDSMSKDESHLIRY